MVGGGIIGLACAEAMANAGISVEVFEEGQVGSGASLGNAGWITNGLIAPLTSRELVREGIRSLVRRGGPVAVTPKLRIDGLRWMLSVVIGSSRKHFLSNLRVMVALGEASFSEFARLAGEESGLRIQRSGLTVVARSIKNLRREVELLRELRDAGYDGEWDWLSSTEVRRLEPSLNGSVVGGVYIASDLQIEPPNLVEVLTARSRRLGTRVHEMTGVRTLGIHAGRPYVELAEGERRSFDGVVVAAGAWTGRLLRGLGVRLPLQAGKGYSATFDSVVTQGGTPLYLLEARCAVSTFGSRTRIAGMFDLDGLYTGLRQRRLRHLEGSAAGYFSDWEPQGSVEHWTGLRPVLPDGIPAVGELAAYPGIYVATGHGMVGMTLAPITGLLIKDLVSGEALPRRFRGVSLERFRI